MHAASRYSYHFTILGSLLAGTGCMHAPSSSTRTSLPQLYLSSCCLLTVQAIARKCFLGWYHLHATKKAMCIRLQTGRRHPACHGALSHILRAYRLSHKALSLPCVSHRSAPHQSPGIVFATLFPSSHLTSLPPD